MKQYILRPIVSEQKVTALTLGDLVAEIEREISVLKDLANDNRLLAKLHAGTNSAERKAGMARACEVEAERLMAILAKYQAVAA